LDWNKGSIKNLKILERELVVLSILELGLEVLLKIEN
jgi:hypothetical protein